MSDHQESVEQVMSIVLPGEVSRPTHEYRKNYQGRDGAYDVYTIEFTVPYSTSDFRVFFDQVITSTHSDFWAASEIWFEVDGGHKVLSQQSKDSNQHAESAHFHFDKAAYGSIYNGRVVQFVLRTGTTKGVNSPATFVVHQYT